jgi:glycosidase
MRDRLLPAAQAPSPKRPAMPFWSTLARPRAALLLGAVLVATAGCQTLAVPAPATSEPGAAPAPAAAPIAVTPQRDWQDAVLYFVIVDRFADGDPGNNLDTNRTEKGTFHGGDLAGLRQQLDEIAELGVTALWITPVVKNIPGFVTGAGFPDWGYHGYWADDLQQLDPRFGSEEELRQLVADAHARGIKVLLDVVYNHAGYDSQYLRDPATRNWFRREDLGTCGQDDETSCVAGLPDFRTELPEVADYLMGAHLGLARRVALDGFRLDTVKHVSHAFWREHRARTRAELGQDFFLLGEVWGGEPGSLDAWFAGDEMDAGFDFSFQGSALGWVQGRGRTVAFARYLKSREKTRSGYHLAHFLSSHDVPGALYQLQGDVAGFRLAAILQLTSIGIPTIYYGEEVGRPGGDWPDNRSAMPWGSRPILPGQGLDRNEALREDYRRLISIRRAHPALQRGTQEALATDGDLLVVAQRDSATGDVVVLAANRAATATTASFALPPEWAGKTVRDAWRNQALTPVDGQVRCEVPPRDACIVVAD